MKNEFRNSPKLRFIIGDVRDKQVLLYAMRGVDIVFHLAALKHVEICEENTWEAVLTNIIGTQHVIEAAIYNNVKKVVNVSTDKAVEPFNLYGVTKACGEKLSINSNFNYRDSASMPDFICIRGGNVIGTSGSVIPLFKKQIEKDNMITITDPSMTRFLMSTREAIRLLFVAIESSIGGELFVMRMPATTVSTIARVMIQLYGNSKTRTKYVGKRPGEKVHEVLVSRHESPFTYELSPDYFVVLPQIHDAALLKKYEDLQKMKENEFSSQNSVILDEEKLAVLLKKERIEERM